MLRFSFVQISNRFTTESRGSCLFLLVPYLHTPESLLKKLSRLSCCPVRTLLWFYYNYNKIRSGIPSGPQLNLAHLPGAHLSHLTPIMLSFTIGLEFVILLVKSCPTPLVRHGLQPTRILCPRDFPDKSTGVGCHFLSQVSFQPKDRTFISCIGRWLLYHWATREALTVACSP